MHARQCKHTKPCCRASPHWHAVLGRCSASTLFVPESTALPERKRKRGRGNKEWLSAIIRPHMPEKGLISQETRENERDERERGTERKRAELRLKERGHQRIATFSFRKLGRTEVVCSVWVSIFKDTVYFVQLCHPSPLKGKPFHSFPHIPSLCLHLHPPDRQ